MRTGIVMPAVGLLAWLGACAPAAPAVDLAEAEASLRAAAQAYTDALVTKNVDGGVGYYAADAVAFPPEGPAVRGLDGLRGMAEGFLQDPAFEGTFELDQLEVAASGDLGYVVSSGPVRYTGPDGVVVSERLRDVHVWRRGADGAWKIVVDIWTADAPPTLVR